MAAEIPEATPRGRTPSLGDLTWEEIRDMDRSRTVAILPVGAVEAHGPHLPLGTDVIIAQGMARAAAATLEAVGWQAVLLPPVWYTAADFAKAFPGTIGVSGGTVTRLVVEVGVALGRQGFRAMAVANAHLDPGHLASLEEAVQELQGSIPVIFPNLSRGRFARRLTEEFQSGACHAGRFEGSIVLAESPHLVREEIARGLPPVPTSLSRAIREGKASFQEAGGLRAYFGWPAEANAEEGLESLQVMGEILALAVLEELE